MYADFVEFAVRGLTPAREQLVNQIIAGGDETKTENLRGQIKGLDRAITSFREASKKYATEGANG